MPVGISGRGAEARQQLRGRRGRREHHGADHRQEREAGRDRREAERLLQVVREEEEDAEHADGDEAGGQVGAAAVCGPTRR